MASWLCEGNCILSNSFWVKLIPTNLHKIDDIHHLIHHPHKHRIVPCWIVALRHYITWLSPRVRRFFVIQEYLVRSRGCRRCIKECAVAQVTGAFLNATPLRRGIVFVFVTCLFIILFVRNVTWNKYHHETFRRSMTLYQWIRHLAAPATGRGTRFAVHCDLIISTIRSMITVQQERYCFCVCNLFVYHPIC